MVSILQALIPVYVNEFWKQRVLPLSNPVKVADGKILVNFYKDVFAERLRLILHKPKEKIEIADIDISNLPQGWNTIEIPCDKTLTTTSQYISGTSLSDISTRRYNLRSGRITFIELNKEVQICLSAEGYDTECISAKALALSSKEPLRVILEFSEPVNIVVGSGVALNTGVLEVEIDKKYWGLVYGMVPIHYLYRVTLSYVELGILQPIRVIRLTL